MWLSAALTLTRRNLDLDLILSKQTSVSRVCVVQAVVRGTV